MTFIAAEVQVFSVIQEKIDDHEVLYVSIAEAEELYNDTLLEFGVQDENFTREMLKMKITSSDDYSIKPSHIYSADA